jgi:hypothetical protein
MSKMILLLLLAAPAGAVPTRTKAPATEAPRPAVRYDFDDDLVEGGTLTPDGVIVDTLRPIKRSTMIKIRETFVPEMLKSAEDQ